MAQTERHCQLRWNIIADVMPRAFSRFLEKNEDYGEGSDEFGARAQIMDISRKYKKLKAAIWDDEELTGEPVLEVLDDMIGHLLLMREHLDPPDLPGPFSEFTHAQWSSAY